MFPTGGKPSSGGSCNLATMVAPRASSCFTSRGPVELFACRRSSSSPGGVTFNIASESTDRSMSPSSSARSQRSTISRTAAAILDSSFPWSPSRDVPSCLVLGDSPASCSTARAGSAAGINADFCLQSCDMPQVRLSIPSNITEGLADIPHITFGFDLLRPPSVGRAAYQPSSLMSTTLSGEGP